MIPSKWDFDSDEDYYEAMEEWKEEQEYDKSDDYYEESRFNNL